MTHAPTLLPRPRLRALAWAIFCSIALAACGGGGGGLVRAPEPAAIPPPPPPAVPAELCPAPITANCVVSVPANSGVTMTGGRQSDYALILRPGGSVTMRIGDYRFSEGTTIEAGLRLDANLQSNVTVESSGHFILNGTVQGRVVNHGATLLWGTVNGDVANTGTLIVESSIWHDPTTGPRNRIHGNFLQSATGTLAIAIPYSDSFLGLLHISGRADIEGSTLQLYQYGDDWGPYPLPAAPLSAHVLRADGGVFGQFASWTSPGLFIEGALRYGSNDVWFDLKRISVQAAMTTAGAAPLTLASAGNLDRALAGADLFAGVPSSSLNRAQQGFLQSAGRLLWMSDPQQAQRSLDSLSGSVHADALHRTGRGDAMASALGQRLLTLQPGQVSGNWSQPGVNGTVAGFDQWIGSRLLFGASTSIGNNTEAAGQARDHERQAALYLRWFGEDGWYAGGSAGFARHALTVDRPIDLGRGGRWNAHSQRGISVASMESEAGRRFALGGGVLAPYAALGAQVIRSERALEQGTTGFELALQPNTQARLAAGLGLRYGKRWHLGEGGWLQLDADARMQHGLADAGSPLQAAFIGVPEVGFALPGNQPNTSGWLDVGLRGGTGSGWNWSLGHAGSFAGTSPERQWLLGLQRMF